MNDGGLSYHDVKVIVDGIEYKIFGNRTVELSCNRAAGWRLWKVARDLRDWKLIGGEYDGNDFKIIVKDIVILDVKKEADED